MPFVAVIAACFALAWAYREPLAKIGAGKGAAERGALHRLASHPNATVLRAAVDDLRAAGIPFVVYVAPINVEALRGNGDFDPEELERRLEALRVSIGASPQEWLDLHAALPAARFRDRQNHLLYEGCLDVGRPLAERALRLMAKRPVTARPASIVPGAR